MMMKVLTDNGQKLLSIYYEPSILLGAFMDHLNLSSSNPLSDLLKFTHPIEDRSGPLTTPQGNPFLATNKLQLSPDVSKKAAGVSVENKEIFWFWFLSMWVLLRL